MGICDGTPIFLRFDGTTCACSRRRASSKTFGREIWRPRSKRVIHITIFSHASATGIRSFNGGVTARCSTYPVRQQKIEPMRTLLILAGLSVAAAAGGVQSRATLKASEARAATAAEWSGDAAQFVAAGLTNRTLVIAMCDQQDVVGCDALIDRAVADQEIRKQIHAAGFLAIQCGDRRKELTN